MSNLLYTAAGKFGLANPIYYRVINSFPKGIQMAFAYGSGVFRQEGQSGTSQNMMDFVFVVDQPFTWHQENLKKHANHYSFLQHFGPKLISNVQECSAGMYFNTIVPFEDRLIKYGVTSTASFKQDLLQWDHLYISGRLHKPVMIVTPPDEHLVKAALKSNLKSAVHTSLLLLPEKFSEVEFFTKVAELSYAGDIRMGIGEDRNKVKNIVMAGMDNFRVLYKQLLQNTDYIYWDEQNECLEQESTYSTRHGHLNHIPANVLKNVPLGGDLQESLEAVKDSLARDQENCNVCISKALQRIVSHSSKWQSMKGIFTGGLIKSTKYGSRKVRKWIESLNK